MTKMETVKKLADKTGLPRPQIKRMLQELANLAYANAKDGFVIPGIGKLVLVQRKERIGRNPLTGAQITIPPKKVVKFRLAKVCKKAVLSA